MSFPEEWPRLEKKPYSGPVTITAKGDSETLLIVGSYIIPDVPEIQKAVEDHLSKKWESKTEKHLIVPPGWVHDQTNSVIEFLSGPSISIDSEKKYTLEYWGYHWWADCGVGWRSEGTCENLVSAIHAAKAFVSAFRYFTALKKDYNELDGVKI